MCISMRLHMCVCIHMCAFFCNECCMHFGTGVLGTSACAGVYVIQMFLWYQRTHLRHTRCRSAHICIWMYMCICMHIHMDAYIVYDISWHVEALLLRFSVCVWVCKYIYMYMCAHVCVYMCMCICMYMYICVSVYMYAYTCIYTRVCVYICTRVGAFCLFVLSNPSTTCVYITCVF